MTLFHLQPMFSNNILVKCKFHEPIDFHCKWFSLQETYQKTNLFHSHFLSGKQISIDVANNYEIELNSKLVTSLVQHSILYTVFVSELTNNFYP